MQEKGQAIRRGLAGILMSDFREAMRHQASADTPAIRRSLIRTAIAAVEGLTWMYREHIREYSNELGLLSDIENQAFAESIWAIDESGKASEQKHYVSTTAMIRFSTEVAERFLPGCAPDYGSQGWSDLKSTFLLRNRITHPKKEADLKISDAELQQAISAFFWIAGNLIEIMERTSQSFRDRIAEYGEILELLKAGDETTLALYQRALRQR